jgi:two-component system nitrogen regulation response regulator GlnG
MVQRGLFRQNLYYRIRGLALRVPPLRERMEDLPDLITHFLRKAVPGESRYLSEEANRFSTTYQWPGNIRELENVLDTLAKISIQSEITLKDIESQIASNTPNWEAPSDDIPKGKLVYSLERNSINRNYKKLVTDFEQALTSQALKDTGSISGASDKLGLPRTTLTSKIKAWGWNLPEQMQ